ncbi:MAG TPA: SDR family oxidoreductase [Ktedonobacterales bacterium]|nr:SDR family oxidoreductase [Ktedonobacterales bacterium]
MILVVGASGRLGSVVTRQLLARGEPVRAMARRPAPLAELEEHGAQIVIGDVRDAAAVRRACQGADRVLATFQGLDGKGRDAPRTIDGDGNRLLIDAAKAAGVRHFVFTSALGARPDDHLEHFRLKYGAEEYLRQSGLSYTIIRPTPFMELWATIIGEPILQTGKARIFGRGTNPVNFVSVEDVAHLALLSLDDAEAHGRVIEIGGPENLTLEQVVALFERVSGRSAQQSHVPLPMMRVMAVVLRAFNPALARMIELGILMDTADNTFDPAETLTRFPMRLTPFEEVVRSRVAAQAQAIQQH